MKRFLFIAAAFLFAVQLNAQRVGFLDTEKILASIPEYNSAKSQLESLEKGYRTKVENEFAAIEKLYNAYQANKGTMSQVVRAQKENEIISKEEAAKKLQESYFGENGIMQKKSQELLSPIKERVQAAIERVAKSGGYMMIVDIASQSGVIYTNSQYDLSQEVIKVL
ncbi:MAG: OmpH family outer membrane protein [Candidatus Egerieousia sp.]|jgi:outer membrane protein|nr:OmpH family outer membrane protein [bacterium]MDD7071457.1 OmpH family outer membrane protein [bacterium]MDY5024235.1 OmpH family outer membrane protein [Candidatus Egerieousia sp.]MDY5255414.1 OmpH family outer membrane protein [Candidatus Egerieousia sp.]MDY5319137.1 OmpH family outer membrane protein [Candidatus Egerieousia sp.]